VLQVLRRLGHLAVGVDQELLRAVEDLLPVDFLETLLIQLLDRADEFFPVSKSRFIRSISCQYRSATSLSCVGSSAMRLITASFWRWNRSLDIVASRSFWLFRKD